MIWFINRILPLYMEQVDYVGRHILLKLMDEWRLMDELAVLRAIYLLGSGIYLFTTSYFYFFYSVY